MNSNNRGSAIQPVRQILQKRYSCSHCSYSSDRRDLFTRHENIHKEDKPFHCYVCSKMFNRADHVKKHFLRMHRGLNYDISRTKRSLPQVKFQKLEICKEVEIEMKSSKIYCSGKAGKKCFIGICILQSNKSCT